VGSQVALENKEAWTFLHDNRTGSFQERCPTHVLDLTVNLQLHSCYTTVLSTVSGLSEHPQTVFMWLESGPRLELVPLGYSDKVLAQQHFCVFVGSVRPISVAQVRQRPFTAIDLYNKSKNYLYPFGIPKKTVTFPSHACLQLHKCFTMG
jgi:hypothetical protein